MEDAGRKAIADALTEFVNTTTSAAAIRVLRERSADLLSDFAIELLDRNTQRSPDDAQLQSVFALRRRAIVAARERGLDAGVSILYLPDPAVDQSVHAFLNAAGYPAMFERLRDDPILSTDAARECLDMAALRYEHDATATNVIAAARELVRIARTDSVEAARVWLLSRLLHSYQSQPIDPNTEIGAWLALLRIVNTQSERDVWGEIHINLAQLYRRGDDADKPDSIDRAMASLSSALEVFTPEHRPEHFYGCQRVLGNVWFGDDRLSPNERHTRALRHYSLALPGTSAKTTPADFLHVNFMMAACLQELGDTAGARLHLRDALAAIDEASISQSVATCVELAKLLRGGADVLAAFEEALSALSRRVNEMPPDQDAPAAADAHLSLGNIYREFAGEARAQYLELAIAHTAAAAQILNVAGDTYRWGKAEHNLGAAYFMRIAGEKADNREQAIAHYQTALRVHTRDVDAYSWALTHNALGAAMVDRFKGDPADNAEAAIEMLNEARPVWEELQDSFHLAECYTVIGGAHMTLVSRAGPRSLDAAIENFELADRALSRAQDQSLWARLQNNIAAARVGRNRGDDLTKALAIVQAAVAATDRDTESYLWAQFKGNEAAAHSQFEDADESAHLVAALASLGECLTVYDAVRYPAERRDVQSKIGLLLMRRAEWRPALTALRDSIAAAERVFGSAYTESGRLAEAQQLASSYRNAAYCLVRLGEHEEAFLLHDRGKTRLLAEGLQLAAARFDSAVADEVRSEIERLEDEMRQPDNTASRRSDAQLGNLIAAARERLTRLRGVEQIKLPTMSLQEYLAQIPHGSALVVPLLTTWGGAVLVVRSGATRIAADDVLSLTLTIDEVNALLIGEPERPGMLRTYSDFYNARDDLTERRRAFNRYLAKIDQVCQQLWHGLMATIHDRLHALGIARDAPVLIVPHGALALLPLHATTGGKQRFLDRFTARYAPSVAVLALIKARAGAAAPSTRLLAIADPTGDLEYARFECAEIERSFADAGSTVLCGRAASRAAVIDRAGASTHVHFACHGFFAWWDALRSGLVLADHQQLDVAELMSPRVDLAAASLVTLSACETGMSDYARFPDEYLGLPASLLLAGAPTVVSSLWAVPDRCTALLMSEFYRRLLAGDDASTALAGAQRWLSLLTEADLSVWLKARRGEYGHANAASGATTDIVELLDDWLEDLAAMTALSPNSRRYEHPYYWAAFTTVGR